MTRRLINFTRGEARALLHRLEAGTLPGVLAEGDPVYEFRQDWVAERCEELARDLKCREPFVCLRPVHEVTRRALDLDILTECVEGSTWAAVHDPAYNTDRTPQAHAAAVRSLRGVVRKLADAFGKSPDYFELPQA